MSFFQKLKQFFGAGTVKVELTVPPSVSKAELQVPGKVTLNALSDQHVIDVKVLLEEEWETGRDEQKQTRKFELGKLTLAQGVDMKQGEQQVFEFVLPFTLVKSNADDLKEMGGMAGALGKAVAFAKAEKSRYSLSAVADVKGAAFDPRDDKEIKLI
jgi:hypothetical protein